MSNDAIHAATPGTAVTGQYMGVPFSGVVRSTRGHTINHLAVELRIVLDTPIEPFPGSIRSDIGLTVYADGSDIDGRHFGYID